MRHFEDISPDTCCICGAAGPLTGEHKLMRSALKGQFGDEPVVVGRFGEPQRYQPIQSLRSRRLHFGARLCAPCNNQRTQRADLCFDRINKQANEALSKDGAEHDYAEVDGDWIAMGQHFAKLLACHMADEVPVRWARLAAFALDANVVISHDIDVEPDPMVEEMRQSIGEHGYAAHGGLGIVWSKSADSVASFRSSRTFGRVRYIFSFSLSPEEMPALRSEQPEFWLRCRGAALDQPDDLFRRANLARLGFS